MFYILLVLLFLAVIVEGTFSTVPWTLVCLVCLMIVKRDTVIFPLAFVSGLLLDAMALRPLGATSLFLLTFVFLLLLYQRKYEIYSYQFVMAATFVGSVMFLLIFSYNNILIYAVISALAGGLLFSVLHLEFRLPEKASTKG